mgnify:CR=1 FL=1|jgi:hypothetical protein
MGFLDHSTNNIILDAVLTDYGRQALAANDGSFSIFKFAFSDEEVDYGNIVNFGRTVGKEKIEKNTPVLEAITQGSLGQKYRTLSVNNDALTRLPVLTLESTAIASGVLTMNEGESKTVTATQTLVSGGTLDPDITDYSFRITMNSLFLRLATSTGTTLTPDSVDSDNIATYSITSLPSIGADGRSGCTFQVIAKPVTDDLFNTYKQKGGNIVEKIITISGNNSGAFTSFRTQISSVSATGAA